MCNNIASRKKKTMLFHFSVDYTSVVAFSSCDNSGSFGGKILKSMKLLMLWHFSSLCLCRSLVPQIWHLWIGLVPYQAEHRFQVSHSLETQAAWSESGCQELLQTYTSHFRYRSTRHMFRWVLLHDVLKCSSNNLINCFRRICKLECFCFLHLPREDFPVSCGQC